MAATRQGLIGGGGGGGTDSAEVTTGAGVGGGDGGGGADPAEMPTSATGVVAVVAHCGCGGGDIGGGDIGGGGDTITAGGWEIGGGGGGAVSATRNGTFPCNGKVSMEVSHLTASSRAVPSMWPM